MGLARTDGYRRIDSLIDEMGGEEEALAHMLGLVTEGSTLVDISKGFGIAYGALWRWLSSDRERMGDYETALKGHADMVVHEVKGIADRSDDPKLMVDSRKWLSSKWDRNRFAENSKVEISGSVSLISLLSSLKDVPSEPEAIEVVEFVSIPAPVTSPEKIPAENFQNADEGLVI